MAGEDRYPNFDALAAQEPATSYSITTRPGADPRVAIIATHGGKIEAGTSELARAIAGDAYSLYLFEGRKANGNRDLHITSHHFDEPRCLAIVREASTVLAVHGCQGENAILVGGLDEALADALSVALVQQGLPAHRHGHRFPATNPLNICNRGARHAGAQLELTLDMRRGEVLPHIARIARRVLGAPGV